jgi:hypothetical protein
MADKKNKIIEASMPGQLRNMVVAFGVGRVKHELEEVVTSLKGDTSNSGQISSRFISPEARQRISEAQHRRWAKVRQNKAKASSAKTGKPGRPRKVAA